MKPEDLAAELRRLAQEKPRELAQAQADKIQKVYDRALAEVGGRDIEEVKKLLATEWRSTLGSDLEEPNLSKTASVLAEGRGIKVNMNLKIS